MPKRRNAKRGGVQSHSSKQSEPLTAASSSQRPWHWPVVMCGAAAALGAVLLLKHLSVSRQQRGHRAAQSSAASGYEKELGDLRAGVRQSGVPAAGLGTYSRRAFKTGATVGQYRCTLVPVAHAGSSIAESGAYAWRLNSSHYCDGYDQRQHNPMRYVNSVAKLETCSQQNIHIRIRSSAVDYAAAWAACTRLPWQHTQRKLGTVRACVRACDERCVFLITHVPDYRSVLGYWVKPMRDAVRNTERWENARTYPRS